MSAFGNGVKYGVGSAIGIAIGAKLVKNAKEAYVKHKVDSAFKATSIEDMMAKMRDEVTTQVKKTEETEEK